MGMSRQVFAGVSAFLFVLGGLGDAMSQEVLRPPAAFFEAPPGPSFEPVPVAMADLEVIGPGAGRVHRGDAGLHLDAGPEPAVLLVPGPDLAHGRAALRLRLRHEGGRMMAYQVVVRPVRLEGPMPWNPVPVTSDGAFHDYDLPLDAVLGVPPAGVGWTVVVHLAPEPASVDIAEVSFVGADPPRGEGLALNHDTRRALRRLDQPWTVAPGSGSRFVAWVGVVSGGSGTLRFTCMRTVAGGAPSVLVERVVELSETEGRWSLVSAALPEGACELRFSIEAADGADAGKGCWGSPLVYMPGGLDGPRPIILLSNDTLRADHMSCYGYARETTPHMDQFASESVRFENAVSEEPGTLQAHMTMLTGLHPRNHGLTLRPRHRGRGQVLEEDVTTLAEVLARNGYVTGGFVGVGHILAPERGFGNGFDVYSTPESFRTIFSTRAQLDRWIRDLGDAPFFLFFHHYDIHSKVDGSTRLPYAPVRAEDSLYATAFDPPPPLTRPGKDLPASAFLMAINAGQIEPPDARERDYLVALYDDGIRSADRVVGEFFDLLKALGIYDEALIIVTADHGEAFGEHGLYVHSDIYETCAHIPLLLRFPGAKRAGTRVREVVQLADLMPTILEFAGIPCPEGLDGETLYDRIEGRLPKKDTVDLPLGNWLGVRGTEWKLIHNETNGAYELFDVGADPGELDNLYDAAPAPLMPLLAELDVDTRPPRGGWHVRLERGPATDAAVEVRVVCRAPGGIAAKTIRMGEPVDRFMPTPGDEPVLGMAQLAPDDLDEVVVEPTQPEAPLALEINSETPFELRLHDGASTNAAWQGTLEAQDYRSDPPAAALPAVDSPVVVTVWYDLRPPEKLEGVTLTPEQEEHLRALGYVD